MFGYHPNLKNCSLSSVTHAMQTNFANKSDRTKLRIKIVHNTTLDRIPSKRSDDRTLPFEKKKIFNAKSFVWYPQKLFSKITLNPYESLLNGEPIFVNNKENFLNFKWHPATTHTAFFFTDADIYLHST